MSTAAISEVHDTIKQVLDEQDLVKLATLIRMGAHEWPVLPNVYIPALEAEEAKHCPKQPHPAHVLTNATHAVLRQADFDGLSDYSATNPTGVYPGKMWKRHDGIYDAEFRASGGQPEWLLCWYGHCSGNTCVQPCDKHCSVNSRKLIVI